MPTQQPTIPSNIPDRRPRLDSLTGLRFFAALVVVLTHVGFQFSRSTSVIRTESYGYTGVTFFFLLSGFVLTWSCANQPAARFLWLRFSRVWPLHIVTAVFSMTVIASLAVNDGLVGRLLQVFLLQAWSPNQQIYYGGNSVSWSLSAEMFFYLMFPLVITPIMRLRGRGIGITLIVTLIVLAVTPGIAVYAGLTPAKFMWMFFNFPPYRFGEFILGMLLARAVSLGLRIPRPSIALAVAVVGLIGVAWSLLRYTLDTHTYASRPIVALIVLPFFTLVILAGATIDLTPRRNWLSSRWALRLGEWSFALYLVHKPLWLLTRHWGWWQTSKERGGVYGMTHLVAFCLIAVAVAAVAHYVVEKPVERRLRQMATSRLKHATPTD